MENNDWADVGVASIIVSPKRDKESPNARNIVACSALESKRNNPRDKGVPMFHFLFIIYGAFSVLGSKIPVVLVQ